MKPSIKAALYSAFIFPGAGLWSLGQRGRAAVFAIPALIAVVYLLMGAWQIANRIAEQLAQEILATGQIAIDMSAILSQIHAATAQTPSLQHAQWIFIISWILSIFSSYAVGRLKEQSLSSIATVESTDTAKPKE